MRLRRLRNLALAALIAILIATSCAVGVSARASNTLQVATAPTALIKPRPTLNEAQRKAFHRLMVYLALCAYLKALWHATYDIPPYLRPITSCIKHDESGVYTEASHPDSGSGAYQYTPPTWRTWLALWRVAVKYKGPSYSFAYEAPWYVQDAVTVFALTHGGASNWSNRYGYDPCTQGM